MGKLVVVPDKQKVADLLEQRLQQQDCKMSIRQLTKKHIVSRSSLDNVLKGKIVQRDTLDGIAKMLNTSIEDLILKPGPNSAAANRLELEEYIKQLGAAEVNAVWQLFRPVLNSGNDFGKKEAFGDIVMSEDNPEENAMCVLGYLMADEESEARKELLDWVQHCPNESIENYYDIFAKIHSKITERFLRAKSDLNLLGYKRIRDICQKLVESPLYFGDLKENLQDGYITYFDEGDDEYIVTLPTLEYLLEELDLAPLGDIYVSVPNEEKGSDEWELLLRENILDAVTDSQYNLQELEPELQEEILEMLDENIFLWDLEEADPLEKDPFSPENFQETYMALSKLYLAMAWAGEYKNIGKVIIDRDFGQEMFEKYQIPSPF